MNRRQNQSALAAALQISLSIILISISVILLATSFNGATSKVFRGEKKAAGTTENRIVPPGPVQSSAARELSMADRVAYQRAIEEVYWRHRIWPGGENSDLKPSFDQAVLWSQLEQKVEDYLWNSQVLEDYWHRPIRAEQLQTEMNRMAHETKQPAVLRELFAALENDPFIIAECLVRPALSDRLVASLSARDQPIRGEPFDSWRARVDKKARVVAAPAAEYTLPAIASNGTTENTAQGASIGTTSTCTNDTWTPTSLVNPPSAREEQTAIWTGSEMIIWGGNFVNTGGLYNPSTDSWTATSTTNAPSGRLNHTAVWTGSEMIVWGGYGNPTNTGGRYNPVMDSWTPTSVIGAPSARAYATAVWTGSEMIIWGGLDSSQRLNTGGQYNPKTDTWLPTSALNAPTARFRHTAVWTGSEMIIWGGSTATFQTRTGARYNPTTDSWTATTTVNSPIARDSHTAVWLASNMIVWGGNFGGNTGGLYNPSTDSWRATTTANAPSFLWNGYTAVTTDREMIIWGGDFNQVNGGGGRYDPETDSWTRINLTNAPTRRIFHSAVWTGNEMIVWGGILPSPTPTSAPIPSGMPVASDPDGVFGDLNTGGRYCVQYSGPTPTPTPPPTPASTPTPSAICGSFSNSTAITIPASGTSGIAGPYPSNIVVSGLGGAITKVSVALNGLTHPRANDIDALLVGPDHQTAIIMSDVGSSSDEVNLVLDDNAVNSLPIGNPLMSGTFRPTNWMVCAGGSASDPFLAPAPYSLGNAVLAAFNGGNPNGTWSLYLVDDSSGSVGEIANGWTITIATDNCAGPTPVPLPTPTPGVHFLVVAPEEVMEFAFFDFTVTALDENNNLVPSYGGTIHFTESSGGIVPANSGLTNGTGTFHAVFYVVNTFETISGTDISDASITGTSECVLVNPPEEGTPTPTPTPSPTATPPTTPSPTPVSTGIVLVSRLSDASAGASNLSQSDSPPTQTQTDFLPANLSNSAMVGAESGFGTAHSTSISSIAVDQSMGTMLVTGSGTADAQAIIWASAGAGAKVIVLSFTLTDSSYLYSLSGQLSGSFGYCPSDCANAKLLQGNSPIFELTTEGSGDPVTLSGTGTLPPGDYTLSVDVNSGVSCFPPGGCDVSNPPAQHAADFTFALAPAPTPTPTQTPSPTPTETPAAYPLNLSTRLNVGTGSDVGIGGLIITGTDPKQVLLRGLGPSLAGGGVTNALADPFLELHDSTGALLGSNDNWCPKNPPDICTQIIATGIAPTNDLESAILATLDPGAYTVILSGTNNGTGVGLVEIYDLSQGNASVLRNLSTRASVGTGSDIVITGFILGGGTNDGIILLRGLGPSLANSGVTNALVNPTLELRNSDGAVVGTNDDWQNGPPVSFPPSDPLESALEGPLAPGAYTALLSGVNGGTGVGLVEVYDLGGP